MEKIRNYDVMFSNLKVGRHIFGFKITQSFFDLFTFEQDFRSPQVDINLELDKKNTFLELMFTAKGEVEVDCDISGNPYTETIDGALKLVVKFGEEFDDSDDEVWVLPQGEYKINVAQLIYELILLYLPQKRIHPNLDSDEMQSAMDLLDKYAPHPQEESEEESNDERWDALKKLLNK